jgi:hypothetical protein
MYNKEPLKLHFMVNYFTFWILTHLLPCIMSNSPGHNDSSGQYMWHKLKTWYAKVEFITPRFSLDLWSNLRTGIDSISFFFHYISYSIIFFMIKSRRFNEIWTVGIRRKSITSDPLNLTASTHIILILVPNILYFADTIFLNNWREIRGKYTYDSLGLKHSLFKLPSSIMYCFVKLHSMYILSSYSSNQ